MVVAGRIAGIFGVRGEVKCDVTSAARPLFTRDAIVRYRLGTREEERRIESVREHRGRLLVVFEGIGDVAAAKSLVGARLYVERSAIPLREDEYLDDDLIGCDVIGSGGRNYGKVERVEHYPASDMLVVNGRMVPMVAAIVRKVDTGARRVVVDPPAGLLDEKINCLRDGS